MLHHLIGLDHTLVGVKDLEAAAAQYRRLGFTLTPRGSHIGWGTANYCIMFDHDYVELLGIVDPALENNGLDVLLDQRGEGLLGLALASSDAAATFESLQQAGLGPTALQDLSRRLELAEGEVLPKFKLVRLPTEGVSERSLFICQHLTPELIRQDVWLQHDNGATGINSLVVVADDPAGLADYYRQLVGSINVTMTDDTLSVSLGTVSLIFVNDMDLDLLFPGLTGGADYPELPYIAAMTFRVDDPAKTKALLVNNAIAYQEISGGVIRVNPENTCGYILEFIAR